MAIFCESVGEGIPDVIVPIKSLAKKRDEMNDMHTDRLRGRGRKYLCAFCCSMNLSYQP